MRISIRKNSALSIFLYTALLLLTGYGVSYYNSELFHGFGKLIWLIIFIFLTLCFSPVRKLIVPLLNFKPFKNPVTYLYMLGGVLIPYLILKLSIHYEVLIDRRLIILSKNGLLDGLQHYPLIEAVIFAPIWEELLFRGVLLFALLKVVKPIWAVLITSVIFSLFHPAYLFIILVAGIVLASIAIRTKSVIPSMVTHSIWNLYTGKLFLFL
ncbi:CPBP family intramembrane glutamic endopeptidase [Saccharococcus sp. Marseille-Q5394]|uniref:CPBP family intramembrane glutamic endopeptidase n=1 Tax=Saccharococcus sp. Marseille-Q5394 TaxID=2972778 RepID=UPI0021C7F799|nr:type II CAAX endopeptidase family protein [Saccharococcus sp. Marseille-Q5394]